MNYKEAMQAYAEGQSISRKEWIKWHNWNGEKDNESPWLNINNHSDFDISKEDYDANDWEILENCNVKAERSSLDVFIERLAKIENNTTNLVSESAFLRLEKRVDTLRNIMDRIFSIIEDELD